MSGLLPVWMANSPWTALNLIIESAWKISIGSASIVVGVDRSPSVNVTFTLRRSDLSATPRATCSASALE